MVSKSKKFSLKHLTQQIKDYFEKQPDVEFVYLFGSAVTGHIHGESDMDIGIFYQEKPDAERLFTMQSKLEECIGHPIDLVVLNDANPVLAYQIITGGRLIFSRNEFARYRFVLKVYQEYEDLTYYQQFIKRKILENPILEEK